MISAPSGNLGQLCGIEHAMQPFAGRIDRVDEAASILESFRLAVDDFSLAHEPHLGQIRHGAIRAAST